MVYNMCISNIRVRMSNKNEKNCLYQQHDIIQNILLYNLHSQFHHNLKCLRASRARYFFFIKC